MGANNPRKYVQYSNRLSVYLHSLRFRLSVRHGTVGAPKHFTLIFHIALFAVFGMVNLLPLRLESFQRIHSVRRYHRVAISVYHQSSLFFFFSHTNRYSLDAGSKARCLTNKAPRSQDCQRKRWYAIGNLGRTRSPRFNTQKATRTNRKHPFLNSLARRFGCNRRHWVKLGPTIRLPSNTGCGR